MVQPIEDALRHYIAETILFSSKGYPYADNASLLENGVIDSMNVIELVVFLEEQFDIKVNDHEIVPDNFDSISQLAAFVREKQLLLA
jgi:acyl carrier protein